jgi:hypothetical protein
MNTGSTHFFEVLRERVKAARLDIQAGKIIDGTAELHALETSLSSLQREVAALQVQLYQSAGIDPRLQ